MDRMIGHIDLFLLPPCYIPSLFISCLQFIVFSIQTLVITGGLSSVHPFFGVLISFLLTTIF